MAICTLASASGAPPTAVTIVEPQPGFWISEAWNDSGGTPQITVSAVGYDPDTPAENLHYAWRVESFVGTVRVGFSDGDGMNATLFVVNDADVAANVTVRVFVTDTYGDNWGCCPEDEVHGVVNAAPPMGVYLVPYSRDGYPPTEPYTFSTYRRFGVPP